MRRRRWGTAGIHIHGGCPIQARGPRQARLWLAGVEVRGPRQTRLWLAGVEVRGPRQTRLWLAGVEALFWLGWGSCLSRALPLPRALFFTHRLPASKPRPRHGCHADRELAPEP